MNYLYSYERFDERTLGRIYAALNVDELNWYEIPEMAKARKISVSCPKKT
jgi:hypothetical protein